LAHGRARAAELGRVEHGWRTTANCGQPCRTSSNWSGARSRSPLTRHPRVAGVSCLLAG
jgi:hypothetical protein